jgi:hypothetical protein
MPVTFHPSSKPLSPKAYWDSWKHGDITKSPAADASLFGFSSELRIGAKEVLQSSFKTHEQLERFQPCHNGFVQGVIEAYNGHHAISIRPDDVWLGILTQFSFYVNANSEQLRK